MGACASKFKVLRSGEGAAPPADVASRDLNLAEGIMVQKDIKTPAPVDDEPKRQMLSNLFKVSEGDPGTAENYGNEFKEVKQEDKPMGKLQENENIISAQFVTDAAMKDGDPGLENKGTEEDDKGQDVEPANQYVETEASSQKKAEENPVETAAEFEASDKVDNQGTVTEEPDNINKLVEKSDHDKESEVPCLQKHVEEKMVVKKGEEEKPEAEMTKEVEMPVAKQTSLVGKETEKEEAEAKEVEVAEMEKIDEQKQSSEEDMAGAQEEPAEMATFQLPEVEKTEDHKKPESEAEEKSAEPSEQDIAEKKPEMQETEEQTKVDKPASDAEKEADDDELLCPGTSKIETDAEKKTDNDQLTTVGTTLQKEDKQELAVEPPNTEQPGRGDKPEEEK